MIKKKSEKAFIKEIKNELISYYVKDFKEVTLDLSKKYNISVDEKYLDSVILVKDKDIHIDGMKISDFIKYSKDYPNSTIHINYSYPQYHIKSIDGFSVRINNQPYDESDSEELAEKIAKWLYEYYSVLQEEE